MLINLFFPDSRCLGEFPGTHLLLTQEVDHLLTNRLHVIPMLFSLHLGDFSSWHHGFPLAPGFA
jgi:hypothetical protein